MIGVEGSAGSERAVREDGSDGLAGKAGLGTVRLGLGGAEGTVRQIR